ncbi:hypothetical protein DES32_2108 [Methylovirgula ligni]|uniref:Uncharacterized protein n=1 Tax=Methylovirgula ligni TaxID=569860 RepID=A0A3D9YUA0_9HYPH|nr:hypothetical protein DES32_2108 [Methylovirgula ligni]
MGALVTTALVFACVCVAGLIKISSEPLRHALTAL